MKKEKLYPYKLLVKILKIIYIDKSTETET